MSGIFHQLAYNPLVEKSRQQDERTLTDISAETSSASSKSAMMEGGTRRTTKEREGEMGMKDRGTMKEGQGASRSRKGIKEEEHPMKC